MNLPIPKKILEELRRLREVRGAEEKKTQRKESIWKSKVKRFMKTYRKKKILLRQSLGICKGTIDLGKFAGLVYERSSEMNAKVR